MAWQFNPNFQSFALPETGLRSKPRFVSLDTALAFLGAQQGARARRGIHSFRDGQNSLVSTPLILNLWLPDWQHHELNAHHEAPFCSTSPIFTNLWEFNTFQDSSYLTETGHQVQKHSGSTQTHIMWLRMSCFLRKAKDTTIFFMLPLSAWLQATHSPSVYPSVNVREHLPSPQWQMLN